jgi:hypothetical protein
MCMSAIFETAVSGTLTCRPYMASPADDLSFLGSRALAG